MAEKKQRRFQMDTATFSAILNNHLPAVMDSDDAWRRFVLNLFERFSAGNEYKNMETLKQEDADWKKWDDEQKYGFLSDKAYSKCIGIKRRLKDDKGIILPLPNGYLSRNGQRTSKRLTTDDIAGFFTNLA